MRRVGKWLVANLENLILRATLGLLGFLLVVDVVSAVSRDEAPRTFDIAQAALLSLAVLSALCFSYASLLPKGDERREALVGAGAHLFFSVVSVVVAAALEFFLRIYIDQPLFGWAWTSNGAFVLLIIFETLLFAIALWRAYQGITILLGLMYRRSK